MLKVMGRTGGPTGRDHLPLARDNVTRFTKTATELMLEFALSFSMFDIMFTPRDEPFLLSASKDEAGFYINTTFLSTAREEPSPTNPSGPAGPNLDDAARGNRKGIAPASPNPRGMTSTMV
jgi:hypothetical protein